jgi:Exocyst complex component Sec3
VNEAYENIIKAMFDSLLAIARDTASQQASSTTEEEEKEQLNSNISIIENMHYYMETVDDRGLVVLGKFKSRAQSLYNEHMLLYVKAVIRRPLGKLSVNRISVISDSRTFYRVSRPLYNQTRRKTSPLASHSLSPHFGKSSLITTPKKYVKESIFSTNGSINISVIPLRKAMSLIILRLRVLRKLWFMRCGRNVKRNMPALWSYVNVLLQVITRREFRWSLQSVRSRNFLQNMNNMRTFEI